MAYELFYAFAKTTTEFELACFILWFICDIAFVWVVLVSAYPLHQRGTIIGRIVVGVIAGVIFLEWLCTMYPDEREQTTAFWTGVVLQLPISAGSLYLLLARWDTRGHSLEIWYMIDHMLLVVVKRLTDDTQGLLAVSAVGQPMASSLGVTITSLRIGSMLRIPGVWA